MKNLRETLIDFMRWVIDEENVNSTHPEFYVDDYLREKSFNDAQFERVSYGACAAGMIVRWVNAPIACVIFWLFLRREGKKKRKYF